MLGYFLLLFIGLPVIELAVLLEIGRMIGVLPTVGIVVFTGVAGASLARREGFKIFGRIRKDVGRGIMPSEDMLHGALVLAGGIMLLTPGFITDLLGFSALIPLSRSVIIKLLRKKFSVMVKKDEVSIIDARVYDVDEDE